MDFTLATYNILHGYYRRQIIENIQLLLSKQVDMLCVQEAELPLEEFLPPHWKVEYFHAEERGCHLAIAWNTSKFILKDTNAFLLPSLVKPDLRQKFTAYKTEKIQRGALVATFSTHGGKTIRVITTHLAWEGGSVNRINQLAFILKKLDTTVQFDHEILAGDFNTAVPSVFRKGEQKKIEHALGKEWTNVMPNLVWTCDISHTDPQDGFETIAKVCKLLRVKGRMRLDYIFSKHLQVASSEMLDLPGSDHRPLLATFEI
jgi:endonuclease/exonuclease/phosphatase family metal-dependent hydrolase